MDGANAAAIIAFDRSCATAGWAVCSVHWSHLIGCGECTNNLKKHMVGYASTHNDVTLLPYERNQTVPHFFAVFFVASQFLQQ